MGCDVMLNLGYSLKGVAPPKIGHPQKFPDRPPYEKLLSGTDIFQPGK